MYYLHIILNFHAKSLKTKYFILMLSSNICLSTHHIQKCDKVRVGEPMKIKFGSISIKYL